MREFTARFLWMDYLNNCIVISDFYRKVKCIMLNYRAVKQYS